MKRPKPTTMTVMSVLFSLRPVHGFAIASRSNICSRNCISVAVLHKTNFAPYHYTRLFASLSKQDPTNRLFREEVNILYDSKCNVCKLEIDFLRRRDERLARIRAEQTGHLGVEPQTRLKFTDIECENYNPKDPANGGVTYEVGMASMHAVTCDGKVMSGVPVFQLAYEQVHLGWLFAVTKIPWVKRMADKVYNIFAKYRTNMTRGRSIDSLIRAYREKKDLMEQQKSEENCQVCQEKPKKQ